MPRNLTIFVDIGFDWGLLRQNEGLMMTKIMPLTLSLLLCNCHCNSKCNCHGLLKKKLGLELLFVTCDKTEGKFIQTPTFPLLSCFMRLEYHNLRGADNENTESWTKSLF